MMSIFGQDLSRVDIPDQKCVSMKFLWIVLLGFGMICTASAGRAEEPVYDSQGRRDPFAPLVSSGSHAGSSLVGIDSVSDIDVQGIVYDPSGDSMVIVNGEMLRQGDVFGNVLIKSIRQDGIVFEINGNEAFKPLYGDMLPEQQS